MGFLDDLKDFGVGSRGPYGRMTSGAQRLTGTLERTNVDLTEKGINKAIIAASQSGKAITPEQQIEMAEQWGVSIQEVMNRVKPLNQEIEARRLEAMGKTFYGLYASAKQNGDPINEKKVMEWARLSGAQSNEDLSMLMGSVQKLQPQQGLLPVTPGKDVHRWKKDPASNEITVGKKPAIEAPLPQVEKKDTRTTDIKNYQYSTVDPGFTKWLDRADAKQVKKQASEKGRSDLESDIRQAAIKIAGIEAGENILSDALNSKAPKALEALQRQLFVMVKEYEERYGGPGAARRIGFDTVLSNKSSATKKLSLRQATEYLEQTGGDKVKARQMAKDDGFVF